MCPYSFKPELKNQPYLSSRLQVTTWYVIGSIKARAVILFLLLVHSQGLNSSWPPESRPGSNPGPFVILMIACDYLDVVPTLEFFVSFNKLLALVNDPKNGIEPRTFSFQPRSWLSTTRTWFEKSTELPKHSSVSPPGIHRRWSAGSEKEDQWVPLLS